MNNWTDPRYPTNRRFVRRYFRLINRPRPDQGNGTPWLVRVARGGMAILFLQALSSGGPQASPSTGQTTAMSQDGTQETPFPWKEVAFSGLAGLAAIKIGPEIIEFLNSVPLPTEQIPNQCAHQRLCQESRDRD